VKAAFRSEARDNATRSLRLLAACAAKKISQHLRECHPTTEQTSPTSPEATASASNLPWPNQPHWYQHQYNTGEATTTERANQSTKKKKHGLDTRSLDLPTTSPRNTTQTMGRLGHKEERNERTTPAGDECLGLNPPAITPSLAPHQSWPAWRSPQHETLGAN
jgi:hypothetical protein